MEIGRDRFIESAGRSLAAAFAQTDLTVAASLLRAAAKYLEGAATAGGDSGRRFTSAQTDGLVLVGRES
jgi:hypothetical protein